MVRQNDDAKIHAFYVENYCEKLFEIHLFDYMMAELLLGF